MSEALLARTTTHRLRVTEVVRETEDACSLLLECPDGFPGYRPGQFLTLRLPGPDGGGPVARCYSLASSPGLDRELRITVKRVPGGHGSNWICDHVRAGGEIETLPPAGVFTPRSLDGDLLLIAGGSGITPLLSIARSALAGGGGRVALLYANRDEASVIFREELRRLAADHPDRFQVRHWLETRQGLPTPDSLRALAAPHAATAEAFVCGPAPFMDAAEQALGGLGLAPDRIHVERFFSLGSAAAFAEPAALAAPRSAVHSAEVELDGERHRLDWPSDTLLLDALRARGVDAPYSCREGACSACCLRVVEGEVRMVRNEVLDAADLAAGYVLACQALPVSPAVRLAY